MANSVSNTIQQPTNQGIIPAPNYQVQKPNLMSAIGSGVQAAGGWGSALSGIMHLPSAFMGAQQAASRAQNAQSALAGQPYIQNATGGGTDFLKPQVQNSALANNPVNNSQTASNGIIPVASAQTIGGATPPAATTPPTPPAPPVDTTNSPGPALTASAARATNPQDNSGAASFTAGVGALQQQASQPSASYTAAQNQYNEANQKLADVRHQYQVENARLYGTGLTTAQVAARSGTNALLESAAETPLTGEMQGAAQQEGAATGQQGTQQTGLATAAGLTAPQQASPYGTYDPATKTYTPYGGDTSNGGSGIDAAGKVTGGLSASQNYYSTMLPNYTSAANDVTAFNNWLNQPASQGGGQGINFSQANLGNQLQNWALGKNFSDPRFPQLNTFLNDFGNKISAVVGATGGDTTNYKQQLVNAMISPDSTPASIQAQISTIMNVAQQTMKGVHDSFSGNANETPWVNQTPSGYPPFFGNQ